MKLSNNYILNFRNVVFAACFVFCALTGVQAQTPDDGLRIWTTVGSAGTLDETAVGKVFFNRSVVQMGNLPVLTQTAGTKAKKKIGFPQQTISAVIRYNVTPVDGLFPREGCGRQLTVRYLATIGARVVAKLIEVDLATGVEKDTRLTLDSRDFNVVNGYQVRSSRPSDFILFDFTRKAYYVEATLTTGNIIANISAAGIQMIKIDVPNCIL